MLLYIILFILFAPWFWFLLPTKVVGRKNLKKVKKQGVIIACNHRTNLDVFVLGSQIFRHQHFVGKEEIGKFFLNRWILKGMGSFLIDRSKPSLKFYKDATKLLSNGHCLTMFPEGTRNKISEDEMLELKNGLAMFAIKTKCYVVPTYLVKKSRFFCFNKLIIGEPFKLEFDRVSKDNLALATKIVAEKFDELKNSVIMKK